MSGTIIKCKKCISDMGSLDRAMSMELVSFCIGIIGENKKLKKELKINKKEISDCIGRGVKK